jgi:hypothetical protein
VVQPLFFFLAEQIDLAGQQHEEEPALRIAYCDVDEACCSPAAVYRLLKVLRQQYTLTRPAQAVDLWTALQQAVTDAAFQQPEAPAHYTPLVARLRSCMPWAGAAPTDPLEQLEDAKGRCARMCARACVWCVRSWGCVCVCVDGAGGGRINVLL